MAVNFEFNFWDNLFAIIGIIVGSFVAFWIYKLSKRLSATDKYQHEVRITKAIEELGSGKNVILADVAKYHSSREDDTNETYYKQGAGLFTVIPEYGVQFMLMASDERIPVGLVPFEWIKYTRDHDSEDNKPIVVCEFKGIKWYKNFKSPFKEMNYMFSNPHYNEGTDPYFMKYTTVEPGNK